MRKAILGVLFCSVLFLGGCRGVYNAVWHVPKWVEGGVLNVYTGNGHYDGAARWDNFTRNYQQVWNFVDIHFFGYDVRDPFADAPFFGDPR